MRRTYSFKPLSPHKDITISRIQSTTCTIRLSKHCLLYYKSSWEFKYTHCICLDFNICNYFYKIPLATFTRIIPLNLSTFSESGYSYQHSKLIIRSLISVFHIGLVIAPRSVVLAFGFASGQYDRPRRNN